MEVVFRVVDDVSCHTSEGDGKLVEIEGVGIAKTSFLEQLCQILSFDETAVVVITLTKRETV